MHMSLPEDLNMLRIKFLDYVFFLFCVLSHTCFMIAYYIKRQTLSGRDMYFLNLRFAI